MAVLELTEDDMGSLGDALQILLTPHMAKLLAEGKAEFGRELQIAARILEAMSAWAEEIG